MPIPMMPTAMAYPARPAVVGDHRAARSRSAASAGRRRTRRWATRVPTPSPTNRHLDVRSPGPQGDCTNAESNASQMPTGCRNGSARRSAGPDARPRHLLFRRISPFRRAASSRSARCCAARNLLRNGCMSCQRRNSSPPDSRTRRIVPADLALLGLPSARHGRRSGRQAAGRRRRKRVAHAAALGHRPDRDLSAATPFPARWPGAET